MALAADSGPHRDPNLCAARLIGATSRSRPATDHPLSQTPYLAPATSCPADRGHLAVRAAYSENKFKTRHHPDGVFFCKEVFLNLMITWSAPAAFPARED